MVLNHTLPSRNGFMLDIASIEFFVNTKVLLNRDVFRNICNLLFRTTTVDIFCLF